MMTCREDQSQGVCPRGRRRKEKEVRRKLEGGRGILGIMHNLRCKVGGSHTLIMPVAAPCRTHYGGDCDPKEWNVLEKHAPSEFMGMPGKTPFTKCHHTPFRSVLCWLGDRCLQKGQSWLACRTWAQHSPVSHMKRRDRGGTTREAF